MQAQCSSFKLKYVHAFLHTGREKYWLIVDKGKNRKRNTRAWIFWTHPQPLLKGMKASFLVTAFTIQLISFSRLADAVKSRTSSNKYSPLWPNFRFSSSRSLRSRYILCCQRWNPAKVRLPTVLSLSPLSVTSLQMFLHWVRDGSPWKLKEMLFPNTCSSSRDAARTQKRLLQN